MDREMTLSDMVRKAVSSYATRGYNSIGEPNKLYFVENVQEQVFAVLAPYDLTLERPDLVTMVRIIGHMVIIDIDKSGKPLFDTLKCVGIPEVQIAAAWKLKK